MVSGPCVRSRINLLTGHVSDSLHLLSFLTDGTWVAEAGEEAVDDGGALDALLLTHLAADEETGDAVGNGKELGDATQDAVIAHLAHKITTS